MKQKLKYFILISFAVFLEYFRDYLFININLQINFLENLSIELPTFNYTDSNLLFLIKSLDTETLNFLKWGLSFLFAFLYFGIGFLFSKWYFSHKNHIFFTKLFSLGGLLIMFSSFLIFVIGKSLTFENQMNFYYVSIELSHFVQSSLYPFLFLLVFFANNRTKISA